MKFTQKKTVTKSQKHIEQKKLSEGEERLPPTDAENKGYVTSTQNCIFSVIWKGMGETNYMSTDGVFLWDVTDIDHFETKTLNKLSVESLEPDGQNIGKFLLANQNTKNKN